MKSLLIVGQPRSMSTAVYRFTLRATGLKESGVHAGEILNPDQKGCRIKSFQPPQFTKSDVAYKIHRNELLRCAGSKGYCVKDVIQPFSVLRFLREHPETYRVLHVYREPADCQACQRLRGWTVVDPSEWIGDFLRFETVRFEDLVSDPETLWTALERLGYAVERFDYRDQKFREKTARVARKIESQR